jgi:hypothetical protein
MNNQNDKVLQFLNGIGALAESCHALYSGFIDSGFDDQKALWLTGEYLRTMISSSINTNREDTNDC